VRQSRTSITSIAVALAAVAITIPVMNGPALADAATDTANTETPAEPVRSGSPELPAEDPAPVFPRPGGGPRAIHTFSSVSGTQTYLLDTAVGSYRQLPYVRIDLSPDGRKVAVEHTDGRIGVAERRALLRAGDAAVRWTSLPPGSMSGWSPDGKALLTTTLNKDTSEFTAHRYDIATRRLRHTPIKLDCDTCTAGWAADSARYVVRLRGVDPEIPDGPAQYLNPDGTAGSLVGTNGHIWSADAYSPSGRYVVVEPARPFVPGPEPWKLPKVFDLRTRRVVSTISTDWPVVGWYDDRQVVRIAPAMEGDRVTLEVVDIHTGEAAKRVPAPGLEPYHIGLGSSAGLHGEAATLGF
jgi:hypothetical protein